jgi:hypothetical protein
MQIKIYTQEACEFNYTSSLNEYTTPAMNVYDDFVFFSIEENYKPIGYSPKLWKKKSNNFKHMRNGIDHYRN